MAGPIVKRALGRVRILRGLPVARLIALGELAILARDHLAKLEPHERRRIVELVRQGRGRTANLSSRERRELAALVDKAEPRLFLGTAAEKFSPVKLPERVVKGHKHR
jgi:hypothetical protein